METKELVVPEWLKDTIVGEILSFQLNGQPASPFIEPDEEMKSREKEVGQMTHFEKVVYTLLSPLDQKLREMAENDPDPENDDPENEFIQQLYALKEKREILRGILFFSIKSRFTSINQLALRKGHKITTPMPTPSTEEEGEDCENCPMRAICPDAH